MARPGVTYKEVAEAATQLSGQGKNSTIEQIRLLLGTGSSTTIANHLRDWKKGVAPNPLNPPESLPSELTALVRGLWERVMSQVKEKFKTVEATYHEQIAELKKELFKYKNNNQRWQRLYNRWIKDKDQLSQEKAGLQKSLAVAQKENISLSVKLESLTKQLQNAEERIKELHHLHQQAQFNLEHYRESTKEQRLIDQQHFELQIKSILERAVK